MGTIQSFTRDDLLTKALETPKIAPPTHEAVVDMVTKAMPPEKPVETEPVTDDKPKEEPKPKRKDTVQTRIDELVREKKEMEEFASNEYEARLAAQRRVVELEGQIAKATPKAEEVPKVEELKEPKRPVVADYKEPEAYTEAMSKYADERAQFEVKKALKARDDAEAKRLKEAEEKRMAAAAEEQNKILLARTEAAKAVIPDFDEVIQSADRSKIPVPPHVVAVINESEVGPQMAYELAKDLDNAKRIFSLSPTKALLELGRMEEKYLKSAKPTKGAEPPKTPTTTGAPAPLPSLNGAAGDAPVDFSQPMDFKDYKRLKLQQQRRERH